MNVRPPARSGLGLGIAGLGLALLLALSCGLAAANNAPTNDGCMMCHKDRHLARTVGRTGSLTVDAAAVNASAHAKLQCVQCHVAATSLNHPAHLPAVRCINCHRGERSDMAAGVHKAVSKGGVDGSCTVCHGIHDVANPYGRAMCARCHTQAVQEYETSIHGIARGNGDSDAASCHDCHGSTHAVRLHDDPASTVSHEQLDVTCARCHADRQLVMRRKITIPQAVQLFRDSVHGRSKNPLAATCSDCHGAHTMKRASDPNSTIYRANIPATCGRCHPREAKAYGSGIHGQAVARGVTAAPVCTDCHGEHMIQGPHDPTSPVAAGHITETCSHCHEAAGIRETFGLPANRLETYRDSFHGLAARGGSPVVANCASCHGAHDILPSSNPDSRISPAHLGATCGHCHAGAGTHFKIGPVHVALTTPSQPILFWTRLIYLGLIVGTIGFMLFHNLLDFVRKIGRSLEIHVGALQPHAHAAGRWFQRMTVVERIQHGALALSFFTLVYTGFALKFPEAMPFAWLARLEGGYSWRSIIHRVAAVVMILTSLFHVFYLMTRRGRRLVRALRPDLKDAVDLFQNLLYLVGIRRAPARFDRFGYIEKAEYWALIWGTIVMSVTGLMLWFENSSLRRLPKWTLDLATVIHYYEAWLAFLAIVVWHLYQNILNPDVYPMNWTWLTGRVPEAQMRHEHVIEWERAATGEPTEDAMLGGAPPLPEPASAVPAPPKERVLPDDGPEGAAPELRPAGP